MAVLVADTLKPMADFPAAMAENVFLKDNVTSLQRWIDDFIGGQPLPGATPKSVMVFDLIYDQNDALLLGCTFQDLSDSLAAGNPTMVAVHVVDKADDTVTPDNLPDRTSQSFLVEVLSLDPTSIAGSVYLPLTTPGGESTASVSVSVKNDSSCTVTLKQNALDAVTLFVVELSGNLDAPVFGTAVSPVDPTKTIDLTTQVTTLLNYTARGSCSLMVMSDAVPELNTLVFHPMTVDSKGSSLVLATFATDAEGVMHRYSLVLRQDTSPVITTSPLSSQSFHELSVSKADPGAQVEPGVPVALKVDSGDVAAALDAAGQGQSVFLHADGTTLLAVLKDANTIVASRMDSSSTASSVSIDVYNYTLTVDAQTLTFSRSVVPLSFSIKTSKNMLDDKHSAPTYLSNGQPADFQTIQQGFANGGVVFLQYESIDYDGYIFQPIYSQYEPARGNFLVFAATFLSGDDIVVCRLVWYAYDGSDPVPADGDVIEFEEARIPKAGVIVSQTITTGEETDAVSAKAVSDYILPKLVSDALVFIYSESDGLPGTVQATPALMSGRTLTPDLLKKLAVSPTFQVLLKSAGLASIPLFPASVSIDGSDIVYEGVFAKDGVDYTVSLALDTDGFNGTLFNPPPTLKVVPREVKSTALIIPATQDAQGAVTTTADFAGCLESLQKEDIPACFLVTNASGDQTVVPVTGWKGTDADGEIQGYLVSFSQSHLGSISVLFSHDGTLTLTASQSEIPELTTAVTTTVNADGSTCDEFYLAGTQTPPDFDTLYQSIKDGCPAMVTVTYDGHPSTLTCVDTEDTVIVFSCSFVRNNKVTVYTVTWTKDDKAVFSATELDASGIAVDQTVTPGSPNAVSGDAVSQFVGELSALDTTAKDNVVNPINELKGEIDGIKDTLASFAIPIEIRSFTMTPSTTQYERGAVIPQLTFAWTTSMEPDTQSLMKDGQLVPDTDDVGVKTVTDTPTASASYTLEVELNGSRATATRSVQVLPPVYWGSAAPGNHDSDFISALSDSRLSSSKYGKYKVTVAPGEHAYLSYPSSMGEVKGAYIGGFLTELEQVSDAVEHTNASGHTEDYCLYRTFRTGLGEITLDVRED